MTEEALADLKKWFKDGHWVGVFEKETAAGFIRKSVVFAESEWSEYECGNTLLMEDPDYELVAKCASIEKFADAMDGSFSGEESKKSSWNKILSAFL